MQDLEMFSIEKTWFKGNLHTHSNESDGKLAPREVVRIYREKGYDFCAFTEHEKFSSWTVFNSEDFLVIPGIEIESDDSGSGPFRVHHIVGVARDFQDDLHLKEYDNRSLKGLKGAQDIVSDLKERGFITIYCHPVWSRQTFADIADLRDFNAIEVYNHTCSLESNTGGSSAYYWDTFLRQGHKIWGVATDDAHQFVEDYGGGWVVVNASELSPSSIGAALVKGHFYASNGPIIEAYGLRGNQVYVRCSSARSIHFVAFERRGRSFHQEGEQGLREAAYTVHGDEKYVRIEVIDKEGKTAWSNPIFF
ncbi:MAG: PHP domain-containing protein [Firmicutes bacterium]|nr:PHP domain-containing protein [Bacillota bacterium]